MKKKLALLATLAACSAMIASGTLAYYTAQDKAHNVITSGNIEIELVETTDKLDANKQPIPFENVDGVMPGTAVSKIVQVKNTGEADAYIRVKVETNVTLATGNNAIPGYEPISIEYATGTSKTEWTEKNGYYYYNSPVAPGEITKPLFSEVYFKTSMGNEYQNSKAEVKVIAYGTQVANNGKNAVDAAGWPN